MREAKITESGASRLGNETVHGNVNTGETWLPDGTVIKHTEPGKVIAQKAVAHTLLPTQAGFFFGSTDYDEHYMAYVQETVDQLEPLLVEIKEGDGDGSFYYQSSW